MKVPRFRSVADKFIEHRWLEVKLERRAGSSAMPDEYRLPELVDRFGDQSISKISAMEISVYLDQLMLRKDLAPATRNKYRSLLSQIFKFAAEQKWVRGNPALEKSKNVKERQKRPSGPWEDLGNRDLYLDAMACVAPRPLYAMAYFLALTGCRTSEILALKWGDVDLANGLFLIRAIIEQHSGLYQLRTKGHGWRSVVQGFIQPRLIRLLLRWKRETRFGTDTDYVIAHQETGRYYRANLFRRFHRAAIAKAGLPWRTPHDLRHCFARSVQREGFIHTDIKVLLGHKRIESTMRYLKDDHGHVAEKVRKLRAA